MRSIAIPSADGFLQFKFFAMDEIEKADKQTPVKNIAPTTPPIKILLRSVELANAAHTRKSAARHAGQGTESQRNVFLEMSH